MTSPKKSRLPREFWAVNASNLFERGAYYGMLAVLSYHLLYNVGIDSWIVGILTGISMFMINFLPLFSTALAGKFGFKKLLLFSYITLAIGYIVLGLGYSLAIIVLAFIIMGTGSGFEKALIAASISHSSNKENRNYAFNIYYWVINIGAFATPLSILIFSPADYGEVFFLVSLFIVCSFFIILLYYKNPVKPDPSLPVLKAFKNLKIIFKDPKFIYVLIIFSGCWFMLYARAPFVPAFVADFRILPAWYIPILAALNPGTIITLGPIWSYIIKDHKIDSLKLLIIGIIIVSLGFLVLGFSMNPLLLVAGIILLSFGELLSYPAYLSYVSKIPPKEKRSIYMGYSFLPLAIAGGTAPIIGGILYYNIAEGMGMGRLFWGIIACIGLVSASAFMHYDLHYNKDKKVKAGPGFLKAMKRSSFFSKASANIPLFLIPVVLIIGISLGSDPIYRGILAEPDEKDIIHEDITWVLNEEISVYKGELKEGEKVSWDISPPDDMHLHSIDIQLNWEDEPDIRRIRRFKNTGDTFCCRIIIDDTVIKHACETNDHGDFGKISLTYKEHMLTAAKDCKAVVQIGLVECGDFYVAFGIGLLSIKDSSNTYELQIVVNYRLLQK